MSVVQRLNRPQTYRQVATLCNNTRVRRAATTTQKKEGDISDSFASLSGLEFKPLEPRFADLKAQLIYGKHDQVRASWERLLASLREEVSIIADLGPRVIPEIDFQDIDRPSEQFNREYRKRGVAIVRGAIPEGEALQLKEDIRMYIRNNPQTKAFPQDNPQVYELYWSPSQIRARGHPNLLKTQKFLMSFWHSKDPHALVSVKHPTTYADRLRMRMPGDSKFALGPHIDGGGPERWEPEGYGRGKVYDRIFQGEWERYDPWESSCRLPVKMDLYQGAGACSMFRMAQGWLSMSETGPFEGTLLVNPLLSRATAYFLLRPFFSPIKAAPDPSADRFSSDFLASDNWKLNEEPDSWLHGASPGMGQELRSHLHPHLELHKTMTHVPTVRPGDYVAWHCDTIHAVDSIHAGNSDSSVLYIPACPLTEFNAHGLANARNSFIKGIPSPDFPGGVGESNHIGRPKVEDVAAMTDDLGLQSFGLKEWDSSEPGLTPGERTMLDMSNKILGFYP
ncbi:MAG: hypothetical protein M1820_005788 [Bogoriella megaspora]|nr:MAG: hypothetical protein M1820_005788 [Bogoriella megaspora]